MNTFFITYSIIWEKISDQLEKTITPLKQPVKGNLGHKLTVLLNNV